MRFTKIVATSGPVDVARLNFAHGSPDEHAEPAGRGRQAAERAGREVAILGDVPGPKLRIGPVAGGVAELARGSRLVLSPDCADL